MYALTRWTVGVALAATLACRETVFVDGSALPPPSNLTYEVEPSGDPARPAGILLSWDDPGDPTLAEFRVYSRGSTGGSFGLRGATTSNTFHDNGVPHLQYYVVAVNLDGLESAPSTVVTVDERLALARPNALTSLSLNGAVHLHWADNAYLSAPARFKLYRVYSTGYDLDQNLCDAIWSLEGTTVAPEFLAGALPNGVPRCFGVSAVSVEGYESLWSPIRADTPRPDARNTLVYAIDENAALAGFRFWQDLNADGRIQNAELGLVVNGNRSDVDFWVYRDPVDSSLWIVPEYAGTRVRLYATQPIGDLTDIDVAPATGYSRNMIEAVPTYGYVFEIIEGTTLRYAALRVTHVGRDYLIFDWSFQTDPGNPELSVHAGLPTVSVTGFMVTGAQ